MIFLAGCKEVYNPHLKNPVTGYLVVEGNIVAGNDSTFIRLTRTTQVSDTSVAQAETNATIKVEGEGGEVYPLQEEGDGFYFAPPLNINGNEKYRLHIFTSGGSEYISDYVPVVVTPPIDSVSWKYDEANGVTIYVSTHDATNSAQYYRWQFSETWEHRPKYSSELIYDAGTHKIRQRLPQEQIYRCWSSDTSNDISIATTNGLSSTVIFEKPLTTVPYGSEKIDRVYSINVDQFALSQHAYEFWDNLKKNTESLGTLFDPQPFADYGNIHSVTHPTELVIGFINACTVSKQRIFIDWSQVQWPYYFPGCADTIVAPIDIDAVFSGIDFLPINYVLSPPGAVFGSSVDCVDCRIDGGTTIKPPYMP